MLLWLGVSNSTDGTEALGCNATGILKIVLLKIRKQILKKFCNSFKSDTCSIDKEVNVNP